MSTSILLTTDFIAFEGTNIWSSSLGNNPQVGPAYAQGSGFTFGTLPVKLVAFSVKRQQGQVELKWQTSFEFNNKGFAIERKLNGTHTFETIAFIASLSKTGNSNELSDYTYTDINMSTTATQYRLKQMDLDGKAVYSDIRTANGTMERAATMIYPNPSQNGNTNLVFNDNGSRTIRVSDMNGRTVMQFNNYRNTQLQLEGLKQGSYIVTVINNMKNQQETLKLVIAQ